GRLHPRVDAITSLGVALAKIAPIKTPVHQIIAARVTALGSRRSFSRRRTDNRFHGALVSRLGILSITTISHVGRNRMEPVRFAWPQHRENFLPMIVGV